MLPRLLPKLGKASEADKRELYNQLSSQKDSKGATYADLWKKFVSDQAALTGPNAVAGTKAELYNRFATSIEGSRIPLFRPLSDYWNTKMASRQEQAAGGVGHGIGVLGLDELRSGVSSNSSDQSAYAKEQRVAGNDSQPGIPGVGKYVEGKGYATASGAYSKGITANAGGGGLDTEVKTDPDSGNDVITSGPQSVDVSTKTFRPKYEYQAGEDDIKKSEFDNVQSDALFEAFSWVPAGNGLGPHNRLNALNEQNNLMRFGQESMYQPRREEVIGGTHPMPTPWHDSLTLSELEAIYLQRVGREVIERRTEESIRRAPVHVLDDDYDNQPSYKGLPRQAVGPTVFKTVVDNARDFLPWRDPSGFYMNADRYTDSRAGTYNSQKRRRL